MRGRALSPLPDGPLPLVLAFLAPAGFVLSWLPHSWKLWLGRQLGNLAYGVLPGRRRLARQNLAAAFGEERSPEEVTHLCRESFRHQGMTLMEVCTLLFRPPAALLSRVEVEGVSHLQAAAARGRGVLLLGAHLGNWELLTVAHTLTGYPLSVIVRPMDSPVLNRIVTRIRKRSGVEVINKRQALPAMLEALRRQRMVGILLDQNTTRREGVFVPFFGRPASTSKSLALLTLRSGAPVVPVFIHREPDGAHRVIIEPEVRLSPTGDREKDIVAYTEGFSHIVEGAISRWPAQWLWMHGRWRTRPPLSRSEGG
ncbi:MAG: lysophospholipid acyltransferase family protein [Candidatus Methylomirabilia bacterium]